MDLFNTTKKLLPYDGDVLYHGPILPVDKAQHYFAKLLDYIEWSHDQSRMFGKVIITKRKVAWYGDRPFSYTYSNTTKSALPWTSELLDLKSLVEEKTNETYNSCLLNLYHSGEEGMAYHSDGEKDLKKNGTIASLSLGAERLFSFKHNSTKERVSIVLERGSLLVMKGETQKYWKHRLPPTKKVHSARINLTFRTIES